MDIKILGGGCAKCERLEAVTRAGVDELEIDAIFMKVKSMPDIMAYDVMVTPALVVDGQVLCSGRIPEYSEIKGWFENIIQ